MKSENITNENVVIETDVIKFKYKEDLVEFSKTCYYDIYYNGKKVGEVTMTDVPDNISCSSEVAKANALDIYKKVWD